MVFSLSLKNFKTILEYQLCSYILYKVERLFKNYIVTNFHLFYNKVFANLGSVNIYLKSGSASPLLSKYNVPHEQTPKSLTTMTLQRIIARYKAVPLPHFMAWVTPS